MYSGDECTPSIRSVAHVDVACIVKYSTMRKAGAQFQNSGFVRSVLDKVCSVTVVV